MPKWVSIFEEVPIHNITYYVKINGKKSLLPFDRFKKAMYDVETFLWLDESEDEKARVLSIIDAKTIEEFVKLDYQTISEKLLVPYNPRIHKSVVYGTFHKYYLRIISQLRKQLSAGGVVRPIIKTNYPDELTKKVERQPKKNNHLSLLERIQLLNDNPFIDIKK